MRDAAPVHARRRADVRVPARVPVLLEPARFRVAARADVDGRLEARLHRGRGDMVALAERVGADRLELANTQYLGWALENRAKLLPTRAQLERAAQIAEEARARLEGKMEVLFVKPDYFGQRPRACMDGWGR